MGRPTETVLIKFIKENIPDFHKKRIESLGRLKLKKVLARKNPYLFKAKHTESAADLVKQLLAAHLSSQEETVFGDFLESLAIFVCTEAFNGRKSTTEGIDLEFERDAVRYIVSIKSGPHWGNSSQIKKMRDYFRQAKKIVHHQIEAINGCCYGRGTTNNGDYKKLCGQAFWELISGDDGMYQEIIEPLGHRAKERNDIFYKEYSKVENKFTEEFIRDFCTSDKAIDWEKLVAFNSAK
ncbi:MAG: cytosolic protein [Deltaproteobacteria bacterium]|jgi:hypothetical protein|nr:cytosolic protein [Deltaproteobacteria bacterium]